MYSRISDIPSMLNIYLWNEQMNILQGEKKSLNRRNLHDTTALVNYFYGEKSFIHLDSHKLNKASWDVLISKYSCFYFNIFSSKTGYNTQH